MTEKSESGDVPDMTYTVTLMPSGQRFETTASSGLALLKAAAAVQIAMPSSCRNGTCRECICQLVSGEIRYLIDWPGVSLEEKRDGWILPCVACAASDLVIDAPRVKQKPGE